MSDGFNAYFQPGIFGPPSIIVFRAASSPRDAMSLFCSRGPYKLKSDGYAQMAHRAALNEQLLTRRHRVHSWYGLLPSPG